MFSKHPIRSDKNLNRLNKKEIQKASERHKKIRLQLGYELQAEDIRINEPYQLFSGRNLRTVTAVCHISLSRNAFSSAFSFSR